MDSIQKGRALIRGVISEDVESLSELYDICYDVVTRQRQRIPPFLPFEAEDFVHDTFLLLLRDDCHVLRRLRDPSKIRAWISSIFRHLVRNRARRLIDAAKTDADITLIPSADDPRVAAVNREIAASAARIIGTLRPKHKDVYRLWLDGQTQESIGKTLGIPRSTVASIVKRVNELLRAQLG